MVSDTIAGELGQQEIHGHQELPCLIVNFRFFLPQPQQLEECIAGIDALAGMNAGMIGFLWDEDDLYKDIKVDYHSKDINDVAKIVGI